MSSDYHKINKIFFLTHEFKHAWKIEKGQHRFKVFIRITKYIFFYLYITYLFQLILFGFNFFIPPLKRHY